MAHWKNPELLVGHFEVFQVECSNCKHWCTRVKTINIRVTDYEYCPHCGKKMKLNKKKRIK